MGSDARAPNRLPKVKEESASQDGRPSSRVPTSKNVQRDGSRIPTTMLGAPRGIRPKWAGQVGKPHAIGIQLNVGVRLARSEHNGLDYQIRGVVDVPAHPYGDDERNLLAQVLFRATDLPHKERLEYALLDWFAIDGGSGVRIDYCTAIPTITVGKEIVQLKQFTPPDIELDNSAQISAQKHAGWAREYRANRYCRYESRQELNQRFQDILVNTRVLTRSGKLDRTTDESWYRLLQHVITEMQLRGEPPTPWNDDPRVQAASPFFDGELCRKAASTVSVRGTSHDLIVKYGKQRHMEDLYRKGIVYLNPASDYDKSSHNQAVQDDERSIVVKGGYFPSERPEDLYDEDTLPDDIQQLIEEEEAGFSAIYGRPELRRSQYASVSIDMRTDYWMFCISDVLDQRLFADFEADSCVVIRRKPFVDRILSKSRLVLPNMRMVFGDASYIDPLGAFASGAPVKWSLPVHMTKLFRYAYQREVRFVCIPGRFQARLNARCLEIGPISDFAELIVL